MSTTEPFLPAEPPRGSEAADEPAEEILLGDRDGAVDVLPDADTAGSGSPPAGVEEPVFRTPTPGARLSVEELEERISDDDGDGAGR